MKDLNDNAIMIQVKAGNLAKMSLLFNRHHHALYRFLYHMTYNKESSEDMVQNVFYRMLKYRHTFTGKGEFVVWMYHLGRNVLRDYANKQKRTGRHYPIESVSEKLYDGEPVDKQLEKKQEQRLLCLAMEKLDDEERELLTLTKIQELKYSEIAQIINIKEGAVKVRVHRAINRLKTIYKQNGLI